MRSALAALDGVDADDVLVDIDSDTVKVNCEEGCDPATLVQAVNGLGDKFSASIAE